MYKHWGSFSFWGGGGGGEIWIIIPSNFLILISWFVNKSVIPTLKLLLRTSCDVYKEIYWIQQ